MNYADNRVLKSEAETWLLQTDWTVFGTLKFADKDFFISLRKAEAIVRKFFNTMDRLYLGHNLVEAGHRIERAVFLQLGESRSNIHFHFVAKPNADIEQFCETAKCVWDEISSFTMGFESTVIQRAVSASATVRYGLHEFWLLDADTLCLRSTHLAKQSVSPMPMPKLRRLLRRQEKNEGTKERALMRAALAKRREKIAARAAPH